jgi:hypothetical protein
MRTWLLVGREQIGDDGLALALLAILMVGVVKALHWSQRVIVDYYVKKLEGKVREWLRRNGLTFIGFNVRAGLTAFMLGSLFFVMVKMTLHYPIYMMYSLPTLTVSLVAIAIIGFFVSGNVPNHNPKYRQRYFKSFYFPTFAGLAALLFNAAVDFFMHLSDAIVNYFSAATIVLPMAG